MQRIFIAFIALVLAGLCSCGQKDAQIAPLMTGFSNLDNATELEAFDMPSDDGTTVILKWKTSKAENTPDYLVNEQIKVEQWNSWGKEWSEVIAEFENMTGAKISEEMKYKELIPEYNKKLEEKIKAKYSEEPPIMYQISYKKYYTGMMRFVTCIEDGDTEGAKDAWGEFVESWMKMKENPGDRAPNVEGVGKMLEDLKWGDFTGNPWLPWIRMVFTQEFVKPFGHGIPDAKWLRAIDALMNALAEHEKCENALKSATDYDFGMNKLAEIDYYNLNQRTEIFNKKLGEEKWTEYDDGRVANVKGFTDFSQGLCETMQNANSVDARNLRRAAISKRTIALKESYDNVKALLENVQSSLDPLFADKESLKKVFTLFDSKAKWEPAEPAGGQFRSSANYICDDPKEFGHPDDAKMYHFFKAQGLEKNARYRFKVEKVWSFDISWGDCVNKIKISTTAIPKGGNEKNAVVSAMPSPDYFDGKKMNLFIIVICFSTIVVLFIELARRNPNMFIRKIGGLDAVDEAIGRATEMGKPIYFIMGIGGMSDLPTIAAVNILGRVARRAAKYDTVVKVPCIDPVVMTVAQEVVKEAYSSEGRLDAYKEENVFFVTNDQFSYVAAVDGMMVREKPATNFLMGLFYAESLLLSEAGSGIGAIQISGTDALAQLPFFITSTDYTLIGEELYAASAYLSREPLLLGSLRGQDIGKAAMLLMIIAGSILATFGIETLSRFFK
jgi:hypothetical protein